MTPERAQFGARLRAQREAKALSVPDVVKLTKIPEKSVTLLEDGSFEALPAEVFVRGFVKSYCRVVGLDVDATLRDYEVLVRERRPRVPSLARLGTMRGDSGPAAAVPAPAPPPAEKERDDVSIFSALAEAGKGTSRMGLTVAVIILVIVATLTLSLLLRRPGRGGDGVSRLAGSGTLVS
jgi:cytoskeletal protein RodZ